MYIPTCTYAQGRGTKFPQCSRIQHLRILSVSSRCHQQQLQCFEGNADDHVDIDKQNVFTPDGTIAKDTIFEYCRLYEQRIESFGGLISLC